MAMPDIQLGTCCIRLDERTVRWPERSHALTPLEAGLLRTLADARGRCVSRAHILREVWGYHPDVQTRALALCVTRLRRKIESDPSHPEWLLTVRGAGYRLALPNRDTSGDFARSVLQAMDRAGGGRLLRQVADRWEALVEALETAPTPDRVAIACALGECAWRLDLSRPADPLWALHADLPMGTRRGEVAVALSRVLWQGGATEEADRLLAATLQEPWALAPAAAADRRVVVLAGIVRAWTRRLMGHTDDALVHAAAAHAHARALADRALQGAAADQVASALYDQGQLTKARHWFDDALLLLQRTEDVRGTALCRNNLGVLLNEMGHLDEAIEHIEAAIEVYVAEEHELDAASVMCNLADMLLNGLQLQRASAWVDRAEAIWRRHASARGLTRALRTQGRLAVEQGEPDRAEACFRRSIHCAETSTLPIRAAFAQLDLGWVLHVSGRREEAGSHYARAHAGLLAAGSGTGIGLAELWWGCLEHDRDRLQRAREQLRACGSPLVALIDEPMAARAASYAGRRTVAVLRASG
ncbi:MAG: winged helix-turn-helix domain-containing protein [Myxococcales bacterium]|nr:winged helix-turn-helix domain-containing protein [Myxococcales bacterium]